MKKMLFFVRPHCFSTSHALVGEHDFMEKHVRPQIMLLLANNN
jgi:hypothetical protein